MTSRVAVSQPGVLVRLFLRVRMSPAPVLTSARAEGFFASRWQRWLEKVGLLSLQVVEHAFGVGRSGMAAIRVSLCWAALAMLKLGGRNLEMGCIPRQAHKVFCPKLRAEAVPKRIAGLA